MSKTTYVACSGMARSTAVIALSILVFGLLGCDAKTGSQKMPPGETDMMFFGCVVDQDGQPLSGAVVTAGSFKLTPGFMAGEPIVDRTSISVLTAVTDSDGRFSLVIPEGYQVLEIDDVQKEGYGWVFDWMWNVGDVGGVAANTNRFFYFEGEMVVAPIYQPDVDTPAVYPLHADGHPGSVRNPSRGGSDRDPLGNVTKNHPADMLLPSVGPDSPGDDYQAIVEAMARVTSERARSATQPTEK